MSQLFNKIKVAGTSRSTFDLSHHQVTSSDFGYIIPICYRDMVPNDDFVVSPNVQVRLAPLACPTYGNIKCRVHHFFVPYRILYPQWDAFISGDPNNHTVPPYFLADTMKSWIMEDKQFNPDSGSVGRGVYTRLMSNLGLNPNLFLYENGIPGNRRFSAFPFLAYYRLWMDWFMDSNVYDHPAMVAAFNDHIKNGGALAHPIDKYLLTRMACFKKDYFTTAKLHPQDGEPSMVGVDIAGASLNPGLIPGTSNTSIAITPSGNVVRNGGSNPTSKIGEFTVEALRAANSLQRYLERNNFVGTKIINRLLAHFGVSPEPERLDMAEFIGGSSFPIFIGDVTSTNSSARSTTGAGYKAGQGHGIGRGSSVTYHAKEHGIFMSVMSILPDTGYYQGVSRFWEKGVYGDHLDYYHPEFENLGYQEILNHEVFVPEGNYDHYNYEGIFGYTPRYSEYKLFQNDILGGDFTTNASDGSSAQGYMPFGCEGDSFHLFRKLVYDDQDPLALNANFVECDNRNNIYDRIFQIFYPQYDHFYFNIFCDVKATRPMSGFGEPSLDATNTGDGRDVNLPYGGTRL